MSIFRRRLSNKSYFDSEKKTDEVTWEYLEHDIVSIKPLHLVFTLHNFIKSLIRRHKKHTNQIKSLVAIIKFYALLPQSKSFFFEAQSDS
jgi:hypothetical protein